MTATRMHSLRRRLLLWLLVPLIAIGILALVDTYREAVSTAGTVSDRVLAGSALAIAERVIVADNGQLEVDIPYVALDMLTSAAQDRVFYRVEGPPGTFVTGYQALPTPADVGSDEVAFIDSTFLDEPIRVVALQRSASSGVSSIPFVVTVAETTIARTQLARDILLRSALRIAVLIASAAILVWFAVSASLRPLYRLRDAIAGRNPDDLHPIDETVPKEVRGLVETVNSFMLRLGSAIGALRHFTGNASHQLRTPLTIIRTQLALAGRAKTLAEARAAAGIADESVAHAERILTQLQLLARVDEAASDRMTFAPVDLTELARAQTADNVLRARSAGVDLGFDAQAPALVLGDAMLLGELIHNLLDNAIAYAGPGAEATVRVFEDDGVVVEVEDNGAGIAPELLPVVRQRFARGASGSKPGAGLGLPVVDEIAALFGGSLTLGAGRDGRGLNARVTFPTPT